MFTNKTNWLLGIIIVLLGIIIFQQTEKTAPSTVVKPSSTQVRNETIADEEQPRSNSARRTTRYQNTVPAAPDPDELTDPEIRNVRARIKQETGGEYYYYTPGRHVPSLEEIAEKKMEEGNWAERNVRK